MSRKASKNQMQKIVALRDQGLTYTQIAAKLGIPRGSVSRLLWEARHATSGRTTRPQGTGNIKVRPTTGKVYGRIFVNGIAKNVVGNSVDEVEQIMRDLAATEGVEPYIDDKKPEDEANTELEKITINADKRVASAMREAQVWRRKYEEAIKARSIEETLNDMLRDWGDAFPPPDLPSGLIAGRPLRKDKAVRETLAIMISDLHVGEVVSDEAMHGINKYDVDVFLARMEEMQRSIKHIALDCLTGYRFPRLRVYLLGDLINGQFGAMHDELLVTSGTQLMETVYGTAYVLAQFLLDMSQYFDQIDVFAAPGNHGRMSRKPWAKEQQMNWDMIVPQIASAWFLKNENVKFHIPNSFFFVDEVENQRVLGFHGHQIKGWSGIPWYGIKRFDENLTGVLARQGVPIDHLLMGHFHTEAIMDRIGGEVIANPCMKGADEFTLSAGYRPAPAGQTMFGIHPDHGITHRWRLDLQNSYEPGGLLRWWPGGTLQELDL